MNWSWAGSIPRCREDGAGSRKQADEGGLGASCRVSKLSPPPIPRHFSGRSDAFAGRPDPLSSSVSPRPAPVGEVSTTGPTLQGGLRDKAGSLGIVPPPASSTSKSSLHLVSVPLGMGEQFVNRALQLPSPTWNRSFSILSLILSLVLFSVVNNLAKVTLDVQLFLLEKNAPIPHVPYHPHFPASIRLCSSISVIALRHLPRLLPFNFPSRPATSKLLGIKSSWPSRICFLCP